MPPRKSAASPPAAKAPDESAGPEVILDFRFEQGLLYIALVNVSAVPAYRVVRKITGLEHCGNALLKRSVIGSLNLYQWYNQVRNGDQGALRAVTIKLQNEEHTAVVLIWKLFRTRPVRLKWGPLNGKGKEVLVEYLELACERLEME